MNDFESIASDLNTLDEEGLSRVSKLSEMQINLEKRVKDIEQELKTAKESLRVIEEDQLPAAMAEYNIKKVETLDGSTLKISKFYNASIPKDEEKSKEAYKWLVDNGFGDMIKNDVSVRFVRGQEDQAENFASELAERGMAVSTKKKVEPMTLKGFVREQTEAGVNIPVDLFNVFIGERAKITKE